MENLKRLGKIILNKIYFPFLLNSAIQKFRAARQTITTPDEAWDLAINFYHGLLFRGLNINIHPSQIKSEILALMAVVQERQPKIMLEIGTATGGTLFFWSQILPLDSELISLDLPFGRFGGGYLSTRAKFYSSFARGEQKISFIRDDSHQLATFQKLQTILNGRALDFLFIDGDHTYEGAKADFMTYKKLVHPGGLIALHDIVRNPSDPDAQVYRFWTEIKDQYRHEEFIADSNQGGYGLGLIYL
jgi:predicted O-methyltransferase YrrM